MRVLKFKLLIKIDDFTSYHGNGEIQELTEKQFLTPGQFDYVARRIKDDRNFWWQEVERFPDHVIHTSELERVAPKS